MFKNPFSFKGRIGRIEYLISFLIFTGIALLVSMIIDTKNGVIADISLILFMPIAWFQLAQSAKRCHDTGRSGWWQLIPLFWIILIIAKGDVRGNRYGDRPKVAVSL
jgi:uncharacterized membrane protein YhaH (DUF805 family)